MAYVKPESSLVQAAEELLDRHVGRADGMCASCGLPSPCETARHAAEVRGAAGLAGLNGVAGGLGTAGGGYSNSGQYGVVPVPVRSPGTAPIAPAPVGLAKPAGAPSVSMGNQPRYGVEPYSGTTESVNG